MKGVVVGDEHGAFHQGRRGDHDVEVRLADTARLQLARVRA
jgi:hypothetical protein